MKSTLIRPVKTEIVEFVELYNQGDVPVDVSGWTLRDGIGFRFPAGSSVEAGGYLVVAMDPEMFQSKFGKPAVGPWEGKLNNTGETVELWTGGGDSDRRSRLQSWIPLAVGRRGAWAVDPADPSLTRK